MSIQCDNGKIFTWGLPGANFLYFFGPKIITLGGIDGLVFFRNGKYDTQGCFSHIMPHIQGIHGLWAMLFNILNFFVSILYTDLC